MTESRTLSLPEALTNTTAGYGIAVAIQLVLFPAFGLRVALDNTLMISGLFTVASVLRGHLMRRAFETLRGQRRE